MNRDGKYLRAWLDIYHGCGAFDDRQIYFDGLTPIIGNDFRCLCHFSRGYHWIYTNMYIINDRNGNMFCSYGRHGDCCGNARMSGGDTLWNPAFSAPNVRFLESCKVIDAHDHYGTIKRDVLPPKEGQGESISPARYMWKVDNEDSDWGAIMRGAGGVAGYMWMGSKHTHRAFNKSWKLSSSVGYDWVCKYDLDAIQKAAKDKMEMEARIESARKAEAKMALKQVRSRKPGIYCIGNSRHIKVGMSDANAEMRARAQCNPLNECKVHWVLPTAKAMNTERKMHGWMHKHLSHIYGEWFSASVKPQDLMTVATSIIGSQPPQPVLAQ